MAKKRIRPGDYKRFKKSELTWKECCPRRLTLILKTTAKILPPDRVYGDRKIMLRRTLVLCPINKLQNSAQGLKDFCELH